MAPSDSVQPTYTDPNLSAPQKRSTSWFRPLFWALSVVWMLVQVVCWDWDPVFALIQGQRQGQLTGNASGYAAVLAISACLAVLSIGLADIALSRKPGFPARAKAGIVFGILAVLLQVIAAWQLQSGLAKSIFGKLHGLHDAADGMFIKAVIGAIATVAVCVILPAVLHYISRRGTPDDVVVITVTRP